MQTPIYQYAVDTNSTVVYDFHGTNIDALTILLYTSFTECNVFFLDLNILRDGSAKTGL